MRPVRPVWLLAAALTAPAVAQGTPPPTAPAATGRVPVDTMAPIQVNATGLRIDTAASYAEFSVRLFWLRHVGGRFSKVLGRGKLLRGADDEAPQVRVEAWVAVNSVRLDWKRLRRELLSADFFDAEHYPYMHFVSAPLPLEQLRTGGHMDGTLNIRGVRRRVRFSLLPIDCPAPGQAPCSVSVRGQIQRTRFGMRAHRTLLSDHVQLILHIRLHAVS